LAIAIQSDSKGLLVIREGTSIAGGDPVLMMVSPTSQGQLGSKKLTYLDGVSNPTSLIFDHSGDYVFIADSDRIWKMDLTTFNKTLISSSSLLSGKIGTGPSLGSNITAMALHPTLNYLYLAADTNGVIMVDLDTGNRITIIK
jgi:DNA-binding beta-propeller fold protein YncE